MGYIGDMVIANTVEVEDKRVRLSPPTHAMLVEMANAHQRKHQGELAYLIQEAHARFSRGRKHGDGR